MKRFLILILVVLIPNICSADIISLKSGKEVKGKITEITADLIKIQRGKDVLQIPLSEVDEKTAQYVETLRPYLQKKDLPHYIPDPQMVEAERERILTTQRKILFDSLKAGQLVEVWDNNGDKQTDGWIFKSGNGKVTKVLWDSDYNGSIDYQRWEYEKKAGVPEKIEFDKDNNGKKEEVLFFKEGNRWDKREIDTNEDGVVDLRFTSDGETLIQVEGDFNNDLKIDMIESFQEGKFFSALVDSKFAGRMDLNFKDQNDFLKWLMQNRRKYFSAYIHALEESAATN